ncbi:Ubiquitin carboxyl-terminal hydrolase 15 [Camellia lanceoleosa]|uniref:Ubiquitin carboxyl-terminal hydrolase 15 n=1 Tax=Camellia lanceoleosa TaxID=1840588 RepID=A0ACC0H8D2_9ERIC|nr:Ubiquitin carboxyl-terminal hydrolase 15 [Camellia lanceoleosa]
MFTTILRNYLSGAGQKRHNISRDVASFSCKLGMSAATVIPLVHASKNGIHECARCFGPATTRCSRCKAAILCQIIHWRQGHKPECQQLETKSRISSPMVAYTSIDTIGRVSIKSKLRKEDGAVLHSIKGASRKEFQNFDSVLPKEEIPRRHNVNICGGFSNGPTSLRSTITNFGISDLLCLTKLETIVCDIERDFMSEVAEIRDTIPQQGSNKDASMGIMKMFGLRKSIEAW